MINDHYKVTRAFEHTLTLLQTNLEDDVYSGMSNYNSTYFMQNMPTDDELKNEYVELLKDNIAFEYEPSSGSYVGNGFSIPENSIKISYTYPNYSKDGFTIEYKVSAEIIYKIQTVFQNKPVSLSTGNINFTTKFNFVSEYNENKDYSIGSGDNSEKYNGG